MCFVSSNSDVNATQKMRKIGLVKFSKTVQCEVNMMAHLSKTCGLCCILKCIIIVLLFLLVIGIEETELESLKEEFRALKE